MNPQEQRTLHVDLTSGRTWTEIVETDCARQFLGGRGIGDWLLWRELSSETEPLGPDNVLIFSTGVLQGTAAPTSGRTTVLTKSPLTGLYLKTGAGGHFGTALRMTGHDYLVFHGAASTPVYLRIAIGEVTIRDAAHLWGKGVRETSSLLQAEAKTVPIEVACIGQAGENQVKYANIMMSYYHSASRGGAGAVMGSKCLKAIAVDATRGSIEVADPVRFWRAVKRSRSQTLADTMVKNLYAYGTAGDVTVFNDMYRIPSLNWQQAHIDADEAQTLGGRSWEAAGYLKRRRGCSGCVIHCHRYTEVEHGKYAGTYSGGPQLATVTRGGPNCGIGNVEAVLRYNELCNDLGLDSVSTGASIGWLMESCERGLIDADQLDGVEPKWGNEEALLELTRRIAHREGIGDLLAEETRTAAERVGGDSWKWAVQSKGMAPTGVAMQGAFSYALAFAVNPRGPDHLHTETMAEYGITPEARAVILKITGDEKYAVSNILEKRAEIVRWHEDIYCATDALGLCAFATTCAYGIDEELLAELYSAATGASMSAEEIMTAGRRILTLERCFNVREGLTRSDDVLPWRIMNEPNYDLRGVEDPVVSKAKLDRMLSEYYTLHGWDVKSGIPTRNTLRELRLDDLVGTEES